MLAAAASSNINIIFIAERIYWLKRILKSLVDRTGKVRRLPSYLQA
jgi:hypothetical protein